jgi:hypothetical protein
MIDLSFALAGFTVGAIVGLTGVGGGSLMTPLLVLGFGVAPAIAVGTDLLFAGLTKVGGAVAHGLRRQVEWRVAGSLALGSVPAALATTGALSLLPPAGPQAHAVVSIALGTMLVVTAFALVFRKPLAGWASRRRERAPIPSSVRIRTIALGALLGTAVTLSSVGAGALGVTALMLLFPALAASRVVGTDIAHAVPLTLVAGLGHAALGHVDGAMLASLLAGSLPGILVGSQWTARLPEPALRGSIAAALLLAGGKLIAR